MAECQVLRTIAAPFYVQSKRGERQVLMIMCQRNPSTCSSWDCKTYYKTGLEETMCLSSFSHLRLQKQPSLHSLYWDRRLKRVAGVNLNRSCGPVPDQSFSPTLANFRMFEWDYKHTEAYGNVLNASAKVFNSRGKTCVQAGSGTTAGGHSTQETDSYSAAISLNGGQVLDSQNLLGKTNSPQTRLVTITIDGLIDDNDLERLQVQLKKIHGVVDVCLGSSMEEGIRGMFVTAHIQVEDGVSSISMINEIQKLDSELLILPYKSNSWLWRGHKINFGVAGCGKPIILVHGFGGNAGHFAKLIPYFTDHYRVYAIDLLGFGDSDKPSDANYGPELWADLICDFAKEFAREGAVLIGNSIGSLTSLAAAVGGGSELFRGIVLLNCAGAMNRKGLSQDDPLIRFLSPIFIVVEYLLQRPRIANFLFNRFRRKENIRKILEEQAYRNRASVTNQLVDILYKPSTQPGAVDVFVKVFTGDPGPRPEALMENISVPLLLLWGDSDIWTPVNGPVAKYFIQLSSERDNVAVFSLPDVGHCPHDDRPEVAAKYILPFVLSLG